MTEAFAARTSAQCDMTAVAQQRERMATSLRWTLRLVPDPGECPEVAEISSTEVLQASRLGEKPQWLTTEEKC